MAAAWPALDDGVAECVSATSSWVKRLKREGNVLHRIRFVSRLTVGSLVATIAAKRRIPELTKLQRHVLRESWKVVYQGSWWWWVCSTFHRPERSSLSLGTRTAFLVSDCWSSPLYFPTELPESSSIPTYPILCTCVKWKYIYSQKVESVDALKDFLHKVSCATFITSFLPNIVVYITFKVKTENTIRTYSSLVETSLVEETQRPIG